STASSASSTEPLRFVSNMNFSACSFVSKNRRQSFPFSDNLAGTQTRYHFRALYHLASTHPSLLLFVAVFQGFRGRFVFFDLLRSHLSDLLCAKFNRPFSSSWSGFPGDPGLRNPIWVGWGSNPQPTP